MSNSIRSFFQKSSGGKDQLYGGGSGINDAGLYEPMANHDDLHDEPRHITFNYFPEPEMDPKERAYWDGKYRHQPRGDINVADLLMNIFVFLAADKRTLLSVGRVCRSWRERTNYVPQWYSIRPRAPRRQGSAGRGVGSRDEFVAKAKAAMLADKREARNRKVNHVFTKFDCAASSLCYWLSLMIAAGIALASAYAVSLRTTATEFQAQMGAFWAIICSLVITIGVIVRVFYTCQEGYRRTSSPRMRMGTALAGVVSCVCVVSLVAGMLLSSLTWRIAQCGSVARAPTMSITRTSPLCNQSALPLQMQYLFEIPPRSLASEWSVWQREQHDSLHPNPPPNPYIPANVNAVLTSLHCPVSTNSWQIAGSVEAWVVGEVAVNWYAGMLAKNEDQSLVFRTALPFQFLPPPRLVQWATEQEPTKWTDQRIFYIANASQDMVNATLGIGVTGLIGEGVDDTLIPMPEALSQTITQYEHIRVIVLLAAAGALALGSVSMFIQCFDGCFVFITFWAVVAVIAFSPITLFTFGYLCFKDPSRPYCFISEEGAKYIMYAGIVGAVIVFGAISNSNRNR